jgi:hypothetical protein
VTLEGVGFVIIFIALFCLQLMASLYISLSHRDISLRHVFTSRCSVAASNGGRSPSSGFPNCPRVSTTATFTWLSTTTPTLKLKLIYDRQSGAHLGPLTNFSFSLKFLSVSLTDSLYSLGTERTQNSAPKNLVFSRAWLLRRSPSNSLCLKSHYCLFILLRISNK